MNDAEGAERHALGNTLVRITWRDRVAVAATLNQWDVAPRAGAPAVDERV